MYTRRNARSKFERSRKRRVLRLNLIPGHSTVPLVVADDDPVAGDVEADDEPVAGEVEAAEDPEDTDEAVEDAADDDAELAELAVDEDWARTRVRQK